MDKVKTDKTTTDCPCGSLKTYTQCCQPYHDRKAQADTAEKLMRSRYAAYVVGKIDYIAETNDPKTGDNFDRAAAETWSKQSEWLGLEIISAKDNEVEFKAVYIADGHKVTHHEVSLFRFDEQKKCWYYTDGKTVLEPTLRAEPKVGRNEPCACGSGKKSKKCCAA